ncbi:unnamed protein product [Rhodiola kirilowii]
MDSTTVNWEALDALVIDFAKSENLIHDFDSDDGASSPSSSYQSRLVISQIRRFIEIGDIDAAMNLIRLHTPFILNDHRILFRLHKQKFIELLRRGTEEDRESAIDCLRTSLAPCALDAYPEAYEEFKHILLALIYDKDDHSSPVASEWSERMRLDIAGLLSSILRANLHAYDPVFSLTLRYLISIHKGFCLRQGNMSPISDLSDRLLLEQRDPPAIPSESFLEAPPFDEVDIQALAHAVELTRQGAVDSLKFAKGDLLQAFQNELCRMRLDISMLDELVLEYCVYRGIVDRSFASRLGKLDTGYSPISLYPPVRRSLCLTISKCNVGLESISKTVVAKQPEVTPCSAENHPEVSNISDDSTFVNNDSMDAKQNAIGGSTLTTDIELRCSSVFTEFQEDCSISGTNACANLKIGYKNKIHRADDRSRRKRWRERRDFEDFITDPLFNGNRKPCRATSINSEEPKGSEKYEIVLGMKELASKGMASEVVEEINSIDPEFFVQNSSLLFQLKQVEFLKLVSSGDHSGALKVACSHLGPLAANNQALLKPLKETLLALLRPNGDALQEGLPLHAIATSLQVALGRRFGIEEPKLMRIMKATLHTHTEWFKVQMCKDRFEGFLKIDCLKDVNTSLLTSTAKSNVDSGTHDSSQATVSSGIKMVEEGNSPQIPSRDFVYDENAILKVMEFLALPRAEAIHLLAEYNGNAEAVIQQIFM